MDKNKIIKSVKRQEEEKVAVSLKLPASLKEQLQSIGEKESISMNSLIIATLQSFVDDECGKQLRSAKVLLNDLYGRVLNEIENIKGYGLDPDNIEYYNAQIDLKHQIEEIRGE
ncbi:hypothetical protein [Sulfurimonas sp.]|uniref:hypothetical protein n=1 Tax=Sulfurimonas sp. TaxID=2022749 RepID=UPI00286E4A29|nr:hypothetical protein [Sulfurimonas sp.]